MTELEFETHKWSKNDYVVPVFEDALFSTAASIGYMYGADAGSLQGARKRRVYGANYREHTLKLWNEKKQEFEWVSCKGYVLRY